MEQELLPLQPGEAVALISPTSQQRLRISPSVLPEPRGGWGAAGATRLGSRSALGIGGGMGGGMGGIGAAPCRRHEVNASASASTSWCFERHASVSEALAARVGGGSGPRAAAAVPPGALAPLSVGLGVTIVDATRSYALGVDSTFLRGDADADGAPVQMLLAGAGSDGGGRTDETEPHAGTVWHLLATTIGGGGGLRVGVRYRLFHAATQKFLRAVPWPSADATPSEVLEGLADPQLAVASGVGRGGRPDALELRLTDSPDGEGTLFSFSDATVAAAPPARGDDSVGGLGAPRGRSPKARRCCCARRRATASCHLSCHLTTPHRQPPRPEAR